MTAVLRGLWGLGLALAAVAVPARAEVKPNGLFNDGAVLQRGRSVPVWGTARDGEKVTVSFRGQEVSTTAEDGTWMVRLAPLEPGGPDTLTIKGEGDTVEVKDVLVGDVWICSGQSNMQLSLKYTADAEAAIAAARDEKLRLFTVPRKAEDTPQDVVDAKWGPCTPETVPDFSAVAYYFGRDLRKQYDVPIGLISTNYGGTVAEAWTSREALEGDPDFKSIFEKPGDGPNRPSGLYNAMIHPLLPYAIKGAIWYQGESNAGRPKQYRELFPAMIADWRRAWGQGDFPFLFVQLAPYMKIEDDPNARSNWAALREAQLMTTANTPRAGMAVITDVGEEKDIHPKKKAPVGARLARAARAIAYGEAIEYSGPVFSGMELDGDKAVLSFTHVGGGLEAREGDELKGFAVAGKDGTFHKAKATIEGDKVVVTSPDVPHPAVVRFGWANFPVVNLFNKEGLPASPFRTDRPAD